MRLNRVLLTPTFFISPLFAQLQPQPFPESAWDAGRVIISERSQTSAFRIRNQGSKEEKVLTCPSKTFDLRFAKGAYWAIGPDLKIANRIVIRKSTNGSNYQTVAYFDLPDGAPKARFMAYPLDDDKFMLIQTWGPHIFWLDNQPQLGVIAKTDDKDRLVPTGPLDFGTKEPFWVAVQDQGKTEWQINAKVSWLASVMYQPPMITVGDTLLLGFPSSGTYIQYNGHGRRVKTYRVYTALNDERLADLEGYESVVLCAQPRQDGKLLIAARSEDAVLRGRQAYARSYALDQFRDPKKKAQLQEMDTISLQNFPHVNWFVIDPTAKLIEPTAGPDRVPDRIYDIASYKKFTFTFNADGSLAFPR